MDLVVNQCPNMMDRRGEANEVLFFDQLLKRCPDCQRCPDNMKSLAIS